VKKCGKKKSNISYGDESSCRDISNKKETSLILSVGGMRGLHKKIKSSDRKIQNFSRNTVVTWHEDTMMQHQKKGEDWKPLLPLCGIATTLANHIITKQTSAVRWPVAES
jgi:hypothetical protein